MLASLTGQKQAERETEQRKKRERELLLLLAFLSLALDREARLFVAGTITQEVFLFRSMTVIRQCHLRAAALGVQQAGGVVFNAWTVANRAAQAQESFLAAFGRDLANGRYDAKEDGGSGAAARKARYRLYGLRLTGTANAAWLAAVQSSGQDVRWVLGGNEDHCSRCPQLAARGWRPAATLTQVPGDGQTPCLVQCKCRLELRDGSTSFSNSI